MTNEEKSNRNHIIWIILTIMVYIFTIYTMVKIFGLEDGLLRGIFTIGFFIPATVYCLWCSEENDEKFDGEINPEPAMKLFIIAEMVISIGLWMCKLYNIIKL